ncbi:MAG: ABC transporter permease, partial [Candidatus Nitrosotenuis sp.]
MSEMATYSEIKEGFIRNKIGLVGLGILASLIFVSVATALFVPLEMYNQWNNPASWTMLPKSALPSWVNFFAAQKIPEHQILESTQTILQKSDAVETTVQKFEFDYEYDYFPNDFLLQYTAQYDGAPVLKIDIIRPDG